MFMFSTTACADSMKSMSLANDLGNVLASEEPCGLKYNQDAITMFIEKKVEDDDMGFPSTLNLMVIGSKAQIDDMNESQKTAHCTQIKRIAKKYNFTE
jgi:hypothetical protein